MSLSSRRLLLQLLAASTAALLLACYLAFSAPHTSNATTAAAAQPPQPQPQPQAPQASHPPPPSPHSTPPLDPGAPLELASAPAAAAAAVAVVGTAADSPWSVELQRLIQRMARRSDSYQIHSALLGRKKSHLKLRQRRLVEVTADLCAVERLAEQRPSMPPDDLARQLARAEAELRASYSGLHKQIAVALHPGSPQARPNATPPALRC
jgi:hypothetical protein